MSFSSLVITVAHALRVVRNSLRRLRHHPLLTIYFPYIAESTAFHLRTLYLFTASEIYAYLLPIIALVWAISPPRVVTAACWTWLHLLQHGTAAQRLSFVQDKYTAPHLPIPAGRTTKSHAETLRWLLLPACLAYSLRLGIPLHGVIAMLLILALNELSSNESSTTARGRSQTNRSWLRGIVTNVLRAALFVVLDHGAADVASSPTFVSISGAMASGFPLPCIWYTLALACTTLHVHSSAPARALHSGARAGLPVDEDKVRPVLAAASTPSLSNADQNPSPLLRLFTLFALPAWSLFLSISLCFTSRSLVMCVCTTLLGVYTAVRSYSASRSLSRPPATTGSGFVGPSVGGADKGGEVRLSSYNVWFTLMRVLPVMYLL